MRLLKRLASLPALTVVMLSLLLLGCAQQPVREPADAQWTRIVFYWHWPAGQAPGWHREVWLADTVIAPLLERHKARIPVWRVHRRAHQPTGGHFFSWYVFSSTALGDALYADVLQSPTVARLQAAGLLEKVTKIRVTSADVPALAATSDRSWDTNMQAAWPWFAMGVSASWLDLIEQLSRPPSEADTAELDEYYRGISDQVDALWQFQGGHAFLHHLNAIYGYLPVLTGPDRLQRF